MSATLNNSFPNHTLCVTFLNVVGMFSWRMKSNNKHSTMLIDFSQQRCRTVVNMLEFCPINQMKFTVYNEVYWILLIYPYIIVFWDRLRFRYIYIYLSGLTRYFFQSWDCYKMFILSLTYNGTYEFQIWN